MYLKCSSLGKCWASSVSSDINGGNLCLLRQVLQKFFNYFSKCLIDIRVNVSVKNAIFASRN